MIDPQRPDLTVGVLGAGTMGRGIAQVAASAGMQVRFFDTDTAQLNKAVEFISGMMNRAVEKGRMSAEDAKATIDRIKTVDSLKGFGDCHLVVEAIIENLDIKKKVFAELDEIVAKDGILATNTSSLSVTAIASGTKNQERVAGLHFFNPPPLMKLVEVIGGLRTSPEAVAALMAIGTRMGKHTVACQDTPGFLVNHAGRAYGPESLRIIGEGICQFVDIDRVMKDSAGFRMGPFELLDLVGIDIAHSVMEEIYHQYYQEPMYKPSVIGQQRKDGGLHGRKTGAGFYTYEDGKPVVPEETPAPKAGKATVWVSPANADGQKLVAKLLKDAGAELDTAKKPGPDSICVVTPIGMDASTSAVAQGLDPVRTVAVDPLFGGAGRITIMTTPITDAKHRDAIHGLLAKSGTPVTAINDSPGFIAQRIVALIVNVSCNIAQQRVASPEDIDTAVKLGLNYPKGPLEFGDALGADKILQILRALYDFYGDPRYRPSAWLIRRATLGVSLLTPENR
ncbi:MAG: 3-hydroxyacyl-CoA dehydrogenase [Rhodospirillales bacterium]